MTKDTFAQFRNKAVEPGLTRKGRPEARGLRGFTPAGKWNYCLYAVVVKDHAGVVKIGRTTNWTQRGKVYSNWNLANGDGITDGRIFQINEAFIDLNALEAELIRRIDAPRRHGNEWFVSDLRTICGVIDDLLMEFDFAYTSIAIE